MYISRYQSKKLAFLLLSLILALPCLTFIAFHKILISKFWKKNLGKENSTVQDKSVTFYDFFKWPDVCIERYETSMMDTSG